MAIVHTTKEIENTLRENGFNIPKYPRSGDVIFNKKVVGFIDNFTGLVVIDEDAINEILNLGFTVWNR